MFTDETGMFLISIAVLIGAIIGATVGGIIAYNIASSNGSSGWELVGYTALGVLGGGVAGGLLGAGIAAIGPFIGALFAFSSGALAMSVSSSQILAAGATATALGIGVMFATTGKSNGYWAQKYSDDHLPEHIHLKGTDGTNIRIGRDGKTLNGEELNPQQRKALRRLWKQILKLFA